MNWNEYRERSVCESSRSIDHGFVPGMAGLGDIWLFVPVVGGGFISWVLGVVASLSVVWLFLFLGV